MFVTHNLYVLNPLGRSNVKISSTTKRLPIKTIKNIHLGFGVTFYNLMLALKGFGNGPVCFGYEK